MSNVEWGQHCSKMLFWHSCFKGNSLASMDAAYLIHSYYSICATTYQMSHCFSNHWFPRINAITSKNTRCTSFHFTSTPLLNPFKLSSNQYPEALWLCYYLLNGLNPHMFIQAHSLDRTSFISTVLFFSPFFWWSFFLLCAILILLWIKMLPCKL